MKKISILLFALLLSSCASYVGIHNNKDNYGSWKLVYYNSQDGKTIKGNIKDLINAVKNGKQVRVVMGQGSIISAANADFLWVKNNVVYAQNNSQVSCHFEGNKLVFQDDSYYWMFIVDTNGKREAIRWSVGEHVTKGKSEERIPIKWFVKS